MVEKQNSNQETAVINVNRSIGRSSCANGFFEMVVPKARLLEGKRMRLITGYETTILQGIVFEDAARVKQEDGALLRNLAGNAFELHCAAAASLTLLGTAASLAHPSSARRPVAQAGIQPKRQRSMAADETSLDVAALLDACAGE